MRARMLGARGRVVQKGIGEPHVFLLTRASWAEPNGSVCLNENAYKNKQKSSFSSGKNLPTFVALCVFYIFLCKVV